MKYTRLFIFCDNWILYAYGLLEFSSTTVIDDKLGVFNILAHPSIFSAESMLRTSNLL